MNWRQLTSLLAPGQEISIMVHERPDGDAWGSALGLGLVLEDLGYRPRLLRASPGAPDPSAGTYAWLPGQHLLVRLPGEEWRASEDAALLLLDCANPERCEYPAAPARVLLNADHHLGNPLYGRVNWVDPEAGATAQVLCRLLLAGGVRISPEAATCFYLAIAADTGGFRFSNCGGESLEIAAKLVYAGADLPLVRTRLWENRPRPELVLLREVVKRLEYLAGGAGLLCVLPHDLLIAEDLGETETDTVVEVLRGIAGVEAVVLLKEHQPGVVKVSLRSKSYLDSAAFMLQMGGGGHVRAAGCTLRAPLAAAREQVAGLLSAALSEAQ